MRRYLVILKTVLFVVALVGSVSGFAISAPKTHELVRQEHTDVEHYEKSPLFRTMNKSGDHAKSDREHNGRKTFGTALKRSVRSMLRSSNPKRPKLEGRPQAIAGLILGILGILVVYFIPFSILAIVLGSISKKKYYQGYHDSKGMAKAAVILGIIGLSLFALYLGVFIIPFFVL